MFELDYNGVPILSEQTLEIHSLYYSVLIIDVLNISVKKYSLYSQNTLLNDLNENTMNCSDTFAAYTPCFVFGVEKTSPIVVVFRGRHINEKISYSFPPTIPLYEKLIDFYYSH